MDDDGKKPEDAAAEPAYDGPQDEGSELRDVSEEELKQILEAHKKWCETDRMEGERADLGNANLQGADLFAAKLQEANLRSAKLQEANLSSAKLQEANLSRADLTGAKNLFQTQLDQACGDKKTKLPDGLTIEPCTALPR